MTRRAPQPSHEDADCAFRLFKIMQPDLTALERARVLINRIGQTLIRDVGHDEAIAMFEAAADGIRRRTDKSLRPEVRDGVPRLDSAQEKGTA